MVGGGSGRVLAAVASVLVGMFMVVVAACSAPAGKAGGNAAVQTATIVTPDPQGRPSSTMLTTFARKVGLRTGDRLRVEPRWPAPDSSPSDQDIARQVMTGTAELGIVPARAWDTEEVSTLMPLQIPGLVTSEAAAAAVARDGVAAELMSGLPGAGVVGLAMIPEGFRRIFVFPPSTTRTFSWQGSTIRAPRSKMTSELFDLLGATTVQADGGAFQVGVDNGTITAAESSFALSLTTLPARGQAVADVPLFAKFQVIVANRAWFATLPTGDQAALRGAAAATLSDALRHPVTERDSAAAYCAAGGTVGNAAPQLVGELAAAARKLQTRLAADAEQARLIDRLRSVTAQEPPESVVPPCGPQVPTPSPGGRSTSSTGPDARAFPNGTYRMSVTVAELSRGMNQEEAHNHAGVWTLTFDRGALSISGCTGTYVVINNRVELHLGSGVDCGTAANGVLFSARWTLKGTTLRFLDVRSGDPSASDLFMQTLFQGRDFTKIG